MGSLLNIVLLLLLFTIIAGVHEAGHYLVARAFNVHVKEFAIGMGPLVKSKKFKNTLFSIRAIPLGGFANIASKSSEDEFELNDELYIEDINRFKRILIYVAGAVFNFILAILIVVVVFIITGTADNKIKHVETGSLADGSIAVGDEITAINGTEIGMFTNISLVMQEAKISGEVVLEINNKSEVVFTKTDDSTILGIEYAITHNPLVATVSGVGLVFSLLAQTIVGIIPAILGIFTGSGQALGPVGLYGAVSSASSSGFSTYFFLVALVSISIGAFNLLPLPILDGGRILIVTIEAIIRRPLSEKLITFITIASIGVILIILIIVSIGDIKNLLG